MMRAFGKELVAAAIVGAVMAGGVIGASLVEEACTPAQAAQITDLSRIVLRDYLAGDSYDQIEKDVTQALVALDASVLEIDIAAIIEDAILLLVDEHELPAWVLTSAISADGGPPSVLATAHAKRRPRVSP